MKLNLGCGRNYREGYVNCDNSEVVRTDKCFDLRREFPFEPNTADEILLLNVVGEILTNEEFKFVMNSCYNTLKGGCLLTVTCPSAKFLCSFKDPFECRHFTEETWSYFDHNTIRYKNFGEVYGFKPWNDVKVSTDDEGIMTVVLKK